MEDGIDADWLLVDRIIAQRGSAKRKEYLVKWRGLEYGASTWEAADVMESPEDQVVLLTVTLEQGCSLLWDKLGWSKT